MSDPVLPAAPGLLKARIRHTRIFVLFTLPFLFFSLGMLSENGPAHEIMEWLAALAS